MTRRLDAIGGGERLKRRRMVPLAASGRIAGLVVIAAWGASVAGQGRYSIKGSCGAGVWAGRRRGLSLFGSLLAMALLGSLVLGVIVWLEDRSLEERERIAGTQLETLAHGVSAYVHSDFEVLVTTVGAGGLAISLADLRTAEVIPDGFGDVNALGRGFRVMVLPAAGRALDVVVAETVPAGDTLVPSAALLGDRFGGVRMGVVSPEAPTVLRGPTIDQDVSAFQSNFAGVPAQGALGVFARFDEGNVCGDQLYRIANTGCPDANRMETALDLGGNEIVDAGRVEAASLDVVEDMALGGELRVTGALTVGQSVDVTGEVTVAGEIEADSGVFTGTVSANRVESNTTVQTGTVTATGTVMAATVGVTGAVNAASARLGDLQSATVNASGVNARTVTAERVSANSLQTTGNITASSAGISRLTVGSCSGC